MRPDSPAFRRSGVALPLVLRERLRLQQGRTTPATVAVSPSVASTHIWTAAALEEQLVKLSRATVEIQKQIQRGEETYHDEAGTHHIFRGWDGFIDARDPGGNAGAAPVPGGSRRMPGDARWFSSSCTNIARHMRPTPVGTTIAVEPTSEQAAAAATQNRKRSLEVSNEATERPPAKKEKRTEGDNMEATEEDDTGSASKEEDGNDSEGEEKAETKSNANPIASKKNETPPTRRTKRKRKG
jgi:hypothetical protein